jgi:hypothetical protein
MWIDAVVHFVKYMNIFREGRDVSLPHGRHKLSEMAKAKQCSGQLWHKTVAAPGTRQQIPFGKQT